MLDTIYLFKNISKCLIYKDILYIKNESYLKFIIYNKNRFNFFEQVYASSKLPVVSLEFP